MILTAIANNCSAVAMAFKMIQQESGVGRHGICILWFINIAKLSGCTCLYERRAYDK
jgi:hypothetical protein